MRGKAPDVGLLLPQARQQVERHVLLVFAPPGGQPAIRLAAGMKQLTAAQQSQPLRLIPLHALRGQRCAPFIDFILALQQCVHHLPGLVVKGLLIKIVVYLHQLAQVVRAFKLLAALQPVMHQHALDLGQGAYRHNSQHAPVLGDAADNSCWA